MRAELLQKLTADTIALLERDGMGAFDRFARLGSRPRRHNGTPYRGGNVIPLWATAALQGWHTPHWMTFKQAKQLDAQVRKGEKGTVVVYWDQIQGADPAPQGDGAEKRDGVWFAKAYYVFNASQIDGLPPHYYGHHQAAHVWGADDAAEQFVKATGALVHEGRGRACYVPAADEIHMPDRRAFRDGEGYYATLLHELVHWTGAKHRLDRLPEKVQFGAEDYALEELVAELGAALLCCDLGISKAPREDHAVYLASWMKKLKDEPMCIYRAGKAADVAADWLMALARPAAPAEIAA
jgi:antirestriction protein ArdC